jgi:site-specific DNA-methyltransferase (adenine-specific)
MYGRSFAECELAYTSFDQSARMYKLNPNDPTRIHPTQKPVKLYQWLLENYAKPGQRILDTHLGSGSSAIAAHYFGVDFVGCEIDSDYFSETKKRFEMATAQTTLFEIA